MLRILLILFIWNIFIVIIKKNKRFKKINKNIKLFNIGSSHGLCSFNYKDCRNSSYNFGWHSQTFYYDYIVLKNYFNKISKDAICFIPISYFSFADKKCWNKQDMTYRKNLKFYLLEGKDSKEAFLMQYLPLYISVRKKITKILIKSKKQAKVKTGIERIKKHVEILSNQNERNSLIQLEKIIELLFTKNIKIILITTPCRKEYNDFFKKELLDEKFYNNINKIKNKYNLKYLDFSHEYEVFDKEEYFNDYDHLSNEGSKIFMQELKKKLKIEGIEI